MVKCSQSWVIKMTVGVSCLLLLSQGLLNQAYAEEMIQGAGYDTYKHKAKHDYSKHNYAKHKHNYSRHKHSHDRYKHWLYERYRIRGLSYLYPSYWNTSYWNRYAWHKPFYDDYGFVTSPSVSWSLGWSSDYWQRPYSGIGISIPFSSPSHSSQKTGVIRAQPKIVTMTSVAKEAGLTELPANARVIQLNDKIVYEWQGKRYRFDWPTQRYLVID